MRQKSLPDDLFRATVCRPDGVARKAGRPPRPFSLEEESNRKLCSAVIDRKLEKLRSLLEDAGLDVNARDKSGNTAGHQVGGGYPDLLFGLCPHFTRTVDYMEKGR